MTHDPNQHPENAGKHAKMSDAERQEKIAQLKLRRSKLSPEEASLLREVFPETVDEHHDLVCDRLRRRHLTRHEAEDLYQDVFIALYKYILEHGFPDSIPATVTEIVNRRLMRHGRDKGRTPPTEAPPSSTSEVPRSVPDLDRALDLRALARHVAPRLSPEHKQVVEKVVLNGLSHRAAAEALGLTEGQLKARLVAAQNAMRALAEARVPPSQRGPA